MILRHSGNWIWVFSRDKSWFSIHREELWTLTKMSLTRAMLPKGFCSLAHNCWMARACSWWPFFTQVSINWGNSNTSNSLGCLVRTSEVRLRCLNVQGGFTKEQFSYSYLDSFFTFPLFALVPWTSYRPPGGGAIWPPPGPVDPDCVGSRWQFPGNSRRPRWRSGNGRRPKTGSIQSTVHDEAESKEQVQIKLQNWANSSNT